MATVTETTPRPTSLRRRVAGGGVLLLLALLAAAAARFVTSGTTAGRLLRAIEADLDKTDPQWRLHEIVEAQADIPEGQNSARLVVKLARGLPRGWPAQGRYAPNTTLGSPARLTPQQLAELDADLLALEPIVGQARRLADLPRGRHRLDIRDNPFKTLLGDQQETRRVAILLCLDAERLANQGDGALALVACRAALNAGRSIGDEGFLVSQLIRLSIAEEACQAVEKTLAVTAGSEAELAKLDELLADEERFPSLVVALRGERAAVHATMQGLVQGRLAYTESLFGRASTDLVWRERLTAWQLRHQLHTEHPRVLDIMNRAIDIARQPPHEQIALEVDLLAEIDAVRAGSLAVAALGKAFSSDGDRHRRRLTHLRATRGIVALERHRLAKGTWPATLEEALPGLLDPFDGKPLRYRRLPDGVGVYSEGSGLDIGHRLWDVGRRGK